MSLPVEVYIRRFLLHVLPSGFVRIRYFGLLANRCRGEKLACTRELLRQPPPTTSARYRIHRGTHATAHRTRHRALSPLHPRKALHRRRSPSSTPRTTSMISRHVLVRARTCHTHGDQTGSLAHRPHFATYLTASAHRAPAKRRPDRPDDSPLHHRATLCAQAKPTPHGSESIESP